MSATAPLSSEVPPPVIPDAASDLPPAASPHRRYFSWPAWRQVWFRLHWLVGITAGSVLVVIGMTGATLAFRDELLDVLNPGIRHVAPRTGPMISPERALLAVQAARPTERVAQMTVAAKAGTSVRVVLAPPFGVRRGEVLYLDPYDGRVLPEMRGGDFFEWVESAHRWLLLPREEGRIVTGSLAICLLGMALSGLYLRWPKRSFDWRAWLTFDTRLTGRSFLWGLHSVLGTWALVVYLVSTSTGIYWAFDSVRTTIDGWLAVDGSDRADKAATATSAAVSRRGVESRRGAAQPRPVDSESAMRAVDLAPAWSAFLERSGRWSVATLRVPQRATQPVDISWIAADARHERARDRMLIGVDGDIVVDDRYEQGSREERLRATIYPLHLGSYFGLPGRIAMAIAGSMLPVFALTGWMLYLNRRRAGRAARRERSTLRGTMAADASRASPRAGSGPDRLADPAPWLIAYASQTGHAERLAWHTAASMVKAGHAVQVESVAAFDPAMLADYRHVLLVASSFGDGGPPDSARRFWRRLETTGPDAPDLADLRFGLLALGDRRYPGFCGFGHSLDAALRARGATPLFPMIEFDDGAGDDASHDAARRWAQALAGVAATSSEDIANPEAWTAGSAQSKSSDSSHDPITWTLSRRQLLNAGSQGGPLFELTLTPDRECDWQPGSLVDITPPRSVAEALVRPTPRRYSVASIAEDGAIELLVRQERHAVAGGLGGLGLASGWLTELAPIGAGIEMSLVPNASFLPTAGNEPCLYIGNGSGLAGLRSHLRARIRAGHRANWLLFGERERSHDQPCRDEIAHWQATGFLERIDLVFSRDPPRRTYVQDRLREAADDLRAWVARGACIFVCGSLRGMSAGVDEALRDILGQDALDDLIATGRYRSDVY